MNTRLGRALVGLLAMAAGCRGASSSSSQEASPSPASITGEPAKATGARAEVRAAPRWAIARAGDPRARAGSTVVLAKVAHERGERRVVLVADADERSVRALDPEARAEIGQTFAGGAPSSMLVGPDGRLYVALRDRASIAVFEGTGRADGSLEHVASWDTAAEPVALSLSAGGGVLFAVSGWGHTLEAFSFESGIRSFAVDLPREPRSVLPSEDGRTVFVSHASGRSLSAIDIDGETPRVRAIDLEGGDTPPPEHCPDPSRPPPPPDEARRVAAQGYALASVGDRVLASMVLVRPGVPSARSDGYGGSMEDLPSEISALAVIERRGHVRRSSVHVQSLTVKEHLRGRRDCLLPRAMVADDASESVLVACQGIDAVIELPADAPDPARAEKRRFIVDAGPTGIAIDPGEREAWVMSQLARTVSVLSLGAARAAANVDGPPGRGARIGLPIAAEAEDAAVALGRALFHRTGDPRIARDGRGCASCHPDGRDDGLVWSTPEGPRQPPMLAGRVRGTAPYGWSSGHATLADHITVTIERLGGKGLPRPSIEALAAYVESMSGPEREASARREGPEHHARVARGREVFVSDDVGCSRCHREASAWSDGDVHDILSANAADRSPKLDTPSLRFVGGTAPYFHDGRYASLADVLTHTDGLMGSTAHLDERDRSALLAYLESL